MWWCKTSKKAEVDIAEKTEKGLNIKKKTDDDANIEKTEVDINIENRDLSKQWQTLQFRDPPKPHSPLVVIAGITFIHKENKDVFTEKYLSSVQLQAEWPYDYEGGRKDLRNFDC